MGWWLQRDFLPKKEGKKYRNEYQRSKMLNRWTVDCFFYFPNCSCGRVKDAHRLEVFSFIKPAFIGKGQKRNLVWLALSWRDFFGHWGWKRGQNPITWIQSLHCTFIYCNKKQEVCEWLAQTDFYFFLKG